MAGRATLTIHRSRFVMKTARTTTTVAVRFDNPTDRLTARTIAGLVGESNRCWHSGDVTGTRIDPATLPGRPCSAAAALELVGDRWALLAVREISFGNRRFTEIV